MSCSCFTVFWFLTFIYKYFILTRCLKLAYSAHSQYLIIIVLTYILSSFYIGPYKVTEATTFYKTPDTLLNKDKVQVNTLCTNKYK